MDEWKEMDAIQGAYSLGRVTVEKAIEAIVGIIVVGFALKASFPLDQDPWLRGSAIVTLSWFLLWAIRYLFQMILNTYCDMEIDRRGFRYQRKSGIESYCWVDIKEAHYWAGRAFIFVPRSGSKRLHKLQLPIHSASEVIMQALRDRGISTPHKTTRLCLTIA